MSPLAEDIIEKVDQEELDTAALRKRWDEDYDLWRLTPMNQLGLKYKSHTENEPRTNCKKASSTLPSNT